MICCERDFDRAVDERLQFGLCSRPATCDHAKGIDPLLPLIFEEAVVQRLSSAEGRGR